LQTNHDDVDAAALSAAAAAALQALAVCKQLLNFEELNTPLFIGAAVLAAEFSRP
jgi:hypothetical protein